jgi:hypothetical protein
LEALAGFLRRTAVRMRAWDARFSRGVRSAARAGSSGRLPGAAARSIVAACRAKGISLREAAQAAMDLGVERVRKHPGADPAALLADRWRKAAAHGAASRRSRKE